MTNVPVIFFWIIVLIVPDYGLCQLGLMGFIVKNAKMELDCFAILFKISLLGQSTFFLEGLYFGNIFQAGLLLKLYQLSFSTKAKS